MSKTSKATVRPLDDRLVVRIDVADKVSKGGIHLPDTAKPKPQQGEVLAVGPGRLTDHGQRMEMAIKVGDVVLFTQWAGNKVEQLGDDLLILRESDVLGVVE